MDKAEPAKPIFAKAEQAIERMNLQKNGENAFQA